MMITTALSDAINLISVEQTRTENLQLIASEIIFCWNEESQALFQF